MYFLWFVLPLLPSASSFQSVGVLGRRRWLSLHVHSAVKDPAAVAAAVPAGKTPELADTGGYPVAARSADSTADRSVSSQYQESQSGTKNYQRGIVTIGFCTLVFASLSPVNHAALSGENQVPVLLLNFIVSVMAFASVSLGGPFLEQMLPGNDSSSPVPLSSSASSSSSWQYNPWVGGAELGFWKSAGTTANLFGLSLTTADHGAFLIQLTTLIVPLVQGAMGVPIPKRIQTSIAMALVGITLFTQDHSAVSASTDESLLLQGDALCVLAAVFYATYDLRLFQWGKRINARSLMTSKIFTQALVSAGLLLGGLGVSESLDLLQHPEAWCTTTTLLLMAWSGLMVNCLVPFLQVGGQQAIGPTASQTIYSSQPLWAAMISYFWFGETVGTKGLIGAGAFLTALFLAATTEPVKTDEE